jgi:hypothetical protein
MAEPPPVGGQTGATSQPASGYVVRQTLQIVIGGVDAGVGQGQEQVHAIEADSVYLGLSGQVEHGFEGNERFGVWTLAYEARPHGVVDCRVLMLVGFAHRLDLLLQKKCNDCSPKGSTFTVETLSIRKRGVKASTRMGRLPWP